MVIAEDSSLKRIKRNLFKNSFHNAKCYIKFFRGTKFEDFEYYIIASLKKQNPDKAVIHIGFNNINFRNLKNISTTKLAES